MSKALMVPETGWTVGQTISQIEQEAERAGLPASTVGLLKIAATTIRALALGGFTEWSGGENPVGDAMIEAKWRNGWLVKSEASDTARFNWSHLGEPCDIIAYRILPQTEKGS